MEKMTDRYGLRGGMISAVDLLNGIGVYAGLDVIPVAGATGYIDTDYVGKARAALASLKERDFVFVHVEAPDEMGHEGNLAGKIQAIEDFDEKVVGTVLQGIASLGDVRFWFSAITRQHPENPCRRSQPFCSLVHRPWRKPEEGFILHGIRGPRHRCPGPSRSSSHESVSGPLEGVR
jgi:hypothetical protein